MAWGSRDRMERSRPIIAGRLFPRRRLSQKHALFNFLEDQMNVLKKDHLLSTVLTMTLMMSSWAWAKEDVLTLTGKKVATEATTVDGGTFSSSSSSSFGGVDSGV